jgi:hypothetical protein
MASITEKELSQEILDAALTLLEWAEGNTELARGLWNDAFEEAVRIDHNQSLGGSEDEEERAELELTRRFDEAAAARKKFHDVKDD